MSNKNSEIEFDVEKFQTAISKFTSVSSKLVGINTNISIPGCCPAGAAEKIRTALEYCKGNLSSETSSINEFFVNIAECLNEYGLIGEEILQMINMLKNSSINLALLCYDWSSLNRGQANKIYFPSEDDPSIILNVYVPENIDENTKMGVMFHSGNTTYDFKNDCYNIEGEGKTDGSIKGLSEFYNMMNNHTNKPENTILVEFFSKDQSKLIYTGSNKESMQTAIASRGDVASVINQLKMNYNISTKNTIGIGHSVASFSGAALENENPGTFGEYHMAGSPKGSNDSWDDYVRAIGEENVKIKDSEVNIVLHGSKGEVNSFGSKLNTENNFREDQIKITPNYTTGDNAHNQAEADAIRYSLGN